MCDHLQLATTSNIFRASSNFSQYSACSPRDNIQDGSCYSFSTHPGSAKNVARRCFGCAASAKEKKENKERVQDEAIGQLRALFGQYDNLIAGLERECRH